MISSLPMTRRAMCITVTVVAALSLAVLGSACSQEQISEQPALVRSAEQGDAAAQFDLGDRYFNGEGVPQDYGEALRWYRLAADQGHASAQASLGFMYRSGEGVPQDYGEALRWYRLAADQGDASAQVSFGFMYGNGEGVPQDYGEALRWYRLSANQGYASAQVNIGAMYATGEGVPQDYGEALRWYRLAADQGDASAQYNLSGMYLNGRGVPQDDGEAVRWHRLAADQGHAGAQVRLSLMYGTGRGVPQDYVTAHMWANLAADQGNEDARKLRDTFAEAISAGQIAAAQQADATGVPPITFEEVNDRFGVQSTLTDLQKDRQWDAFEGKCVEWTGELTSLSEGFFGGFSIQFKHLRTTLVSDVIVSTPSSEESRLLQWSEGQRYTYRGTLKRYGGAFLPISIDWGCDDS